LQVEATARAKDRPRRATFWIANLFYMDRLGIAFNQHVIYSDAARSSARHFGQVDPTEQDRTGDFEEPALRVIVPRTKVGFEVLTELLREFGNEVLPAILPPFGDQLG
jgi:hypothetical protein